VIEVVYWDNGGPEIVAMLYVDLVESGRLQVPRDRWDAVVAALGASKFRRRYD
jgi:hypothetical protein